MTRKEIRPQKVRLMGNILPNHTKFMETATYEDFSVIRNNAGTTTYKGISPSTTMNLITYTIINLASTTNIIKQLHSDVQANPDNYGHVAPTYAASTGYEVGNYYFSLFKQNVFNDTTWDRTVEIKVNIGTRTNFACHMGLAKLPADEHTNPATLPLLKYDLIPSNVTIGGEHIIRYVIDKDGNIKTYFDNHLCNENQRMGTGDYYPYIYEYSSTNFYITSLIIRRFYQFNGGV